MSSTLWLTATVAALLGWAGLEASVNLWLTSHRVTIVTLAGTIAVQLATVLAAIGLMKPTLRQS